MYHRAYTEVFIKTTYSLWGRLSAKRYAGLFMKAHRCGDHLHSKCKRLKIHSFGPNFQSSYLFDWALYISKVEYF